MSYIGFMRHTVKRIEELFNYYMKNSRKRLSAVDKAAYKDFIYKMEQLYKWGEIEDVKEYKRLMKIAKRDVKEYKRLMKIAKSCDLTAIAELRKNVSR